MNTTTANYRHNNQQTAFTAGQYIYGQDAVSHFCYGKTTSDKSGCGWVAAYNALQMLGGYASPAELIRTFEESGGLLLQGRLGTKPGAISRYFRSQGYMVQPIRRRGKTAFDAAVHGNDVMVLTYAFFRPRLGLHFVAIRYDAAQNKFALYNEYGNDTKVRWYDSVDAWWKERRRCCIAAIGIARPK